MDTFDAKLLNVIQQNNRLTIEQISDAVGLSPTACQRRLKKFRDNGTISADIAVISPESVGRRMTMIVQVSLEREQPEHLDRFKKSMLSTHEVMQCYYVTGSADFILILTAKDMKDYERFTRQFFFDNPNIRHFETSVVMDHVKVGLSIPIIADDQETPANKDLSK
ncbi:MAG: Lrp/AsnC family transcriptional regulator [Desulfuromonadales bacterium]|nr:Lrp/AsnC family transcriptional regulator [Desulfuromonadales bacterium]